MNLRTLSQILADRPIPGVSIEIARPILRRHPDAPVPVVNRGNCRLFDEMGAERIVAILTERQERLYRPAAAAAAC